MSGAAFEIENVSFWYGASDHPALRNVSLRADEGECLLVTGPSGCGKTTLTYLVNGLIPHIYEGRISGAVRVGHQDIFKTGRGWIGSCVGSVFQNPRGQFANQDVLSEIAFGCENQGLLRDLIIDRVVEAMEALGIEDLLDRKVSELSGGQRQMVVLASAYAMNADIFVLDEPAASLDVRNMILLSKTISRLKEQSKTILISEHRLWWLSDLADRIVLMDSGEIKREWTNAQFGSLGKEERERAGVRAWRIDEMGPAGRSGFSGPATEQGVSVDGLSVSYKRGKQVLSGLSASFGARRVTGVVGENGAGKTTLLRCISGLAKESSGVVALAGSVVSADMRLRSIQLVMQEPGYQLFGSTVEEELRSTLVSGGRVPSAANAWDGEVSMALEEFGLGECRLRHPLSLSGGQRQRLAIAVGLMRGASVLLLDEPTSGLDLRNMTAVAAALRKAAKDGATVILVTHDYEFLCAASDDIAELRDGRIADTYPLCQNTESRTRRLLGFETQHQPKGEQNVGRNE